MQFSLYAKTPGEEVFLQTADELPKLQKQSKYVYIRWMGEMGLLQFAEDQVMLVIYNDGHPHSESKLSVPRRVWAPIHVPLPEISEISTSIA